MYESNDIIYYLKKYTEATDKLFAMFHDDKSSAEAIERQRQLCDLRFAKLSHVQDAMVSRLLAKDITVTVPQHIITKVKSL